jgi:hydrogenase-4 component F
MNALAILVLALPATGALLCVGLGHLHSQRVNNAIALATGMAALVLAGLALARPGDPVVTRAFLIDATGGVFLAVIAVVGLVSALLSPGYLRATGRSVFPARRAHGLYYAAFHLFWALLLAIPLVGNLSVAWLLVEATTAASALLVAYSGRRSALEAGWKYLVLTTVGLTVALLGIVVIFVATTPGGGDFATLDWLALPDAVARVDHGTAVVALTLILTGLATKIGWAPVHNWLPDAHSEAPAPVSALLSAALLPTVLLVAWRVKDVFDPALGERTGRTILIGFGLASLALAVPFLWRPLAWKRLLAYSSLEHMGVLALGIGFGHRVAVAGVILHVAGHALAKALGFWASLPLLVLHPQTARRPPSGLAHSSPATAGAVALSLASLAGLPPSPLFVSELFVLLGGVLAGQLWVSAVAATLLALGFLGLAHTTIEGLVGSRRRVASVPSNRPTLALTGLVGASLATLTALAAFLPGSALVDAIARWPG